MNRIGAKQLSETVTNEQLLQMFLNAKGKITDWGQTSIVNKGMTKGTAWNILTKGFNVNKEIRGLAKINMLREFGDFLPDKPQKQKRLRQAVKPFHQEPLFEGTVFS